MNPTVGRVVYFTPAEEDSIARHIAEPLAAHVAAVWNPTLVNLMVIDANGTAASRTSVPFIQFNDPKPLTGFYATWMPYQAAQQAKN